MQAQELTPTFQAWILLLRRCLPGCRALLPLLRGTADSIERSGPALGMAGPVSRGDVGTVHKHLQALGALDPELLDLYRRLALRTVALGIERGSRSPDKAAALRSLLANPQGRRRKDRKLRPE